MGKRDAVYVIIDVCLTIYWLFVTYIVYNQITGQ